MRGLKTWHKLRLWWRLQLSGNVIGPDWAYLKLTKVKFSTKIERPQRENSERK